MAATYGQIDRQVHNILANIEGIDVSTFETNYVAAPSSTNRKNPDWGIGPVEDAVLDAYSQIVMAICETPGHTDRLQFESTFSNLVSGTTIPNLNFGGERRVGLIGEVHDQSNGILCKPVSMDRMVDFKRNETGIYNGIDIYEFCLVDGQVIIHTRPTASLGVYLRWPCFTRSSDYLITDAYPLPDQYVGLNVAGAVAILAKKEGRYLGLYDRAKAEFEAGIAAIRAYRLPEPYLSGVALSSIK